MRRLLVLLVSLALLWCLWWAAASYGLRQGVTSLLQDRRAAGWQAEARLVQSGFPLRLDGRLEEVALVDPTGGSGLTADHVALSAPAWWPGFVTLDLPETPMTVTLSGQPFRLRAQDARMNLRLHPGTALELESATVEGRQFLLSTAQGALLSGDRASLVAVQQATDPVYDLRLETDAVTPGDVIRAMLNLPADWPRAFDALALRGSVGFDRPVDRAALDGVPPQPRLIAVDSLDVRWGEIQVGGEGRVTIDADGIPTGTVTLRLARWQRLLDLASDTGMLGPAPRNQAQLLMGGLANIGGQDGDLEVTLAFADGQMALGPIQLGPAPRILLD
ncbi:hypothetical protein BOO69_03890 [Sulfitobacter alexandrii]|uniref:DUF2125 domain-containing protein n=1 Tax=Sulfitobacter alexandrii TaxID=1917485 RepID=A0A1J0WEB2_9RHOB|nr:DUF2125 domain-containing protein [Sulfitobacter alexandrii]APE42655.1 hypothetical protein BOO69_03890 [Sulfitobacter alexandrii]